METLAAYKDIGQVFSWNNYGIPAWMTSSDSVICISYSETQQKLFQLLKKLMKSGVKLK